MLNLRPYQTKAVNDVRNLITEGHKQVVYSCSTGGGKTCIAADITRRANKNKKRVLFIAHRIEIIEQTIKKLVLLNINPGIIQGNNMMLDSLTHVAMVQTLLNRLDFMGKNYILPDILIVDECHHAASITYVKIQEYIKLKKKNCAIIGLTATPARTDGIGLDSVGYSALVNGPQYADLLNTEYCGGKVYLCEPVVIYSPLTFQLLNAKSRMKKKDYDPETEGKIFGEKIVVNNCVDMYNRYFFGAPCIIFCASVQDCFEVSAAMQAAGWKGGSVYDKMDPIERKDYIYGLGDGKYNFLCSYEIISEGTDVPVVAGCILRRRTKSLIVYMQQVGRSARIFPGKKFNLIIDQCGNSIIHGHPLTRRKWTLEGIDRTEKEESMKMYICTACGALLQTNYTNCPYCGERLKGESGFSETTIKEVEAPMSILPAPVETGYNDIADIEEYEIQDREQAIINRIKAGQMSSFDRFGELARMIGKDRKWTNLVWQKYHK